MPLQRRRAASAQVACAVACLFVLSVPSAADEPGWRRHTIDDSSRGADGVRLADVDADGRLDVVTGWEEGGVVRICRQPELSLITRRWPATTVGKVRSPEDAVFADVDGDGALDVITCCEGKTRTVFVHWAPAGTQSFEDSGHWSTASIAATENEQAWMFCLPLQSDAGPPLLVVGSKGEGATISLLQPGADPRDVADWRLRPLCSAGWIMSLRAVDMDGDGDDDVLFSDRKGPTRGVGWLERPDEPATQPWNRHLIGVTDEEVMFLDVGRLSSTGSMEVAVATKSAGVVICRRSEETQTWEQQMIPMPTECGSGKGVAIGDIDRDGRSDLVVSCEHAEARHGVFWLSPPGDRSGDWHFHPISGLEQGIKFDRLELIDLDADGDLDVMTCEERNNLGVIWYENPSASARPR